MNSRTAFVVVALFVARPLLAQPIHVGCGTMKAAYGSPAEWPTVSGQEHKGGPGVNSMGMLGHSHGDGGFPYCGVYGAEFVTIPYSQTIFMKQGHIDDIHGAWTGGNNNGNVVSYTVSSDPFAFRERWFGTVTATATHPAWPMPTNTIGYPLRGSDTGVVIIEGEVTLDMGDSFYGLKNGFSDIQLVTTTNYDDGDPPSVDMLRLPFWTVLDPTAPIGYSTPHTAVIVSGGHAGDPFNFGSFAILETPDPLPVFGDPITTDHPVTITVSGYAYTATLSNFSRNLVDANLHAGSLGTIWAQTPPVVTQDTSFLSVTFPGGLSNGIHSDLAQWQIQGPPGFEDREEWANLKFFFVVGEGTPPLPPSPLTISQPSNLTVPLPLTVPVPFALPTTTGGTAPVVVTCDPVPGAAFGIGSTSVSCTAHDSGGQSAGPVVFSVTVTGP